MEILEYGKAICYSGYRRGQSPKTGVCPSYEQIKEDIKILGSEGYRYIRMYDPNIHAEYVMTAIRELKLPMLCMVGIDPKPERNNPQSSAGEQNFTAQELKDNMAHNENELQKLIKLANEYEDVLKVVSVGNENTPPWGTEIVTEERLVYFAKTLKASVKQAVTYNEGYLEWKELKELGDILDIISVHSYPLWSGKTIDEAVDFNKGHYEDMKALFPDKQVIFTEVGWATGGKSSKIDPKQISLENQNRYISELKEYIDANKIVAFIFEAFDEYWKSEDDGVERHWGLYGEDRKLKNQERL